MEKKRNKILLVNFLVEEVYGTGVEKYLLRVSHASPLGLEYLSSVISKKKGYEVDILDERISQFTTEALAGKLRDGGYGALGLYLCTEPEIEKKAVHTIRRIKELTDITVMAGGPPFKTLPVLEAGCDLICHGEGEETVLEMMDCIEGRMGRKDVKGISYLEGGKEVRTGPRQLIANLDDIPFPHHDKETFMKYDCLGNVNMRRPYFSVIASRGCPMRCAYCCTHDKWGGVVRFRSPDNVIEEIEWVSREFGARYIAFRDDIFGVKQEWLTEFCEKLIKKGLGIRWLCNLHPMVHRKNFRETISLLSRAGCDTVHYGIQSADDEILRRINRNPVEKKLVKEQISIANKAGMLTFLEFIVGLPGETEDTIRKDIAFAYEARAAYVTYYSLGILHGSEIEREYVMKNREITSLSQEQVEMWVRVARRKYLLNLRTIFLLFYYVLRHNPSWLLNVIRFLPQGLSLVGFGKKWKTF